MTFAITYPLTGEGRGAFPSNGRGGTLNVSGTRLGGYYRAPASGSTLKLPGAIGALAVKNSTSVNINDYAVYMAVKTIQPYFNAVPDGILGPKTETAIKDYQKANGLWVDGVVGPKTCQSLFKPLIVDAAISVDPAHAAMIQRAALGTIGMESNFDPGAVGIIDPSDLGLGQINGPAHPALTVNVRLTPKVAVPWVVNFIDSNFKYFSYDEDAAIASYNLGRGGATSWIRAGRPESFHGTDVWAYVEKIKTYGV